ncbi:MAG: HTH domain-containing protein [Bacteroidales bacterium]|nr:HTH domain-containing protein [Bacteroidales bacterium]
MNQVEKLQKLVILEKFIRQECTGTPDELARRLSISRRTLERKISELNAHGAEIKYSRIRSTYYYNGDEVIDVQLKIKSIV